MLAYVAEALDVLRANGVRTALTMLGLVIGVTAIIAIQTLGSGLAGAVEGVLGDLNDRSFLVAPNTQQADFTRAALRVDDLARIQNAVPGIVQALPAGGATSLVRAGATRSRLAIAPQSDQSFFASPLAEGRTFTSGDVLGAAHVAVLTAKGAQALFPTSDALGASIRIGDRRYVVIGVLAETKTGILPTFVLGDVYVPYTTYEREFLADGHVLFMRFLVSPDADIAATEIATTKYLRDLKGGRVQYRTFDRKSFSKSVDAIFGGVTLVVALIGAVSLLVAGIGILNIMLVSVAERTREIGVRKAIGATRTQVLAQFFIEALVLSAIGCALGLVFGLAIGWLVDRLVIVDVSGVVPAIPWLRSVVIATSFATIVTLVFGTYPAYRAARLDPIEALRYE